MSMIMRVSIEEVNGVHQGAVLGFRSGFQSGVLRLAWVKDGSLFVSETNRRCGSSGDANQGLQPLVWNKQIPFEMKAVRAMSDGFEIEFTMPVDRKTAENLSSYSVESFIYKYYAVYGSPPVKLEKNEIKGVKVSKDGMKARIVVDNLRENLVHQISLFGVRAAKNSYSLVHPSAYYTLNAIPEGEKLNLDELKQFNTITGVSGIPEKLKKTENPKPSQPDVTSDNKQIADYEMIKPLLQRNNCFACHAVDKKQVGLSYMEVAKRNYNNEKILELIHNPQPGNWPDYPVAMPPMPQVSREDGLKITAYINS